MDASESVPAVFIDGIRGGECRYLVLNGYEKNDSVDDFNLRRDDLFSGIYINLFLVGMINFVDGTSYYASYFWISINPIAVALSLIAPDIALSIKEMTHLDLPPIAIYCIVYTLIGIFSLVVATKKLRETK